MKLDVLLSLITVVALNSPALADWLDIASLDSGNATRWPPPELTGGKSWADAFAKASALVANMTLEEKVNMTSGVPGRCVGNLGGVPRLGINSFCLEDGPAGPRPVHGVSQFPAGHATAATWDEELIYMRSYVMGKEFYDQGVHIALAPVTGGPLGRAPRMSRNWEGWYADPYATGVASYLSVKGLQDAGIAATAKHYIAYEQETFRNQFNRTEPYSIFPAGEQHSISSNLDDKTTHEIYLWSFAEAVRAGVAHIMCSYNEVNQTQACHNAYTQNHLLKRELGFQGSIMSDWGGQHDNVASALGGLDMAMPGSGYGGIFGQMWGENLVALVENGTVPEDRITDAATRVLTPWIWLGQDQTQLPEVVFNGASPFFVAPDGYRDVRDSNTPALIRRIGAEGATLLKNTGGLPLKNPQRIAVVGNDATDNAIGTNACGTAYRTCPSDNSNGTMSMGGGSGYVYAPYIITPVDALKARAIDTGAEISAITVDTNVNSSIQSLLPSADVTVVFVNSWAVEGFDRPNINLNPNHEELITAAVNSSSNVVVVMHIPGVVDVEKWIDNENVTAVIAAWYPGQESGNGLVDVLYGDVNPSGKLPFTWAKNYEDYYPNTIIADAVTSPQSNFTEGIFIDYRWFDSRNITPRYEFGFGLSYTTFSYSDLVLDESGAHSDEHAVQETNEPFAEADGNNSLYEVLFTVSATVTNTGKTMGSEVAQLFVSIPEDDQPPRVLRGFKKVKDIAAGASSTAFFEVRRKDLSVWDVVKQTWYIPEGEFTISVGPSSRTLPLSTTWSKTV
ncbi:glycoside hydrolase [Dendrothele bispora CBS 962.96]|uniref:Probable beta-glucosidase G n=1 Tax=Dendrothele bispora (strain CBS 962.96) TaxID=1314807 RepID=A0A4S8L1P9_DENBC|nr:glycoside hydrolase [Dendrothele bispora CBS 962.96]